MPLGGAVYRSANLQTEDAQVSKAKAAEILNVSERSVNTANKVQKEAISEITEKMSSGEISLNSSALAANLPIRNEISQTQAADMLNVSERSLRTAML